MSPMGSFTYPNFSEYIVYNIAFIEMYLMVQMVSSSQLKKGNLFFCKTLLFYSIILMKFDFTIMKSLKIIFFNDFK